MKSEETSKRGHIAVVDDEPMICDIVKRALKREYEVDVFLDADSVLKALEEGRRYDMILCDLRMPHITGRDIYERVKTKWPDQARRIIFMTGLTPQEARDEMPAGMEKEMIKKPFELEQLRTRAHEVAER